MRRGQRTFVSLVRAYREHICNFIFKLEQFDYAGRISSFLTISSCPRQLVGRKPQLVAADGRAGATVKRRKLLLPGFVPDEIDLASIAFKDPKRERERQEQLQVIGGGGGSEAHVTAKNEEDERDKKTKKRQAARNAQSWSKKLDKVLAMSGRSS
eukprot:312273-Hanusia_phi.AAC.5